MADIEPVAYLVEWYDAGDRRRVQLDKHLEAWLFSNEPSIDELYRREVVDDLRAEIESIRKERDMAMEEAESIREAYDQERRMREFAEEQCLAARAKAIEEAAEYHDDQSALHAADKRVSNHHEMMAREHRRFAAAIRALKEKVDGI